MSQTDYLTLLTEAHDFTVRNLYGKTASCDTDLHLKKYDDASIREACKFVQDMLSSVHPLFIVNKCHFICLGANKLLLEKHFQPILTTGYILLNHCEKEYYTDREELFRQLKGIQHPMKLKYHAWLTLGDYIIDPTYITTHRVLNPEAYPMRDSYDNRMIFFKHTAGLFEFDNGTLEYIPQLTGTSLLDRRMPL
ncbi:hypothetical protein [Bacteroides fragilis]|uniref:hypothetical protein n=1 Tax=Bacteroides fragilis TaxID=817 RepID=UPI001C701799|nr:hypothetical protein [Bacteroides fragilis]MBW9280278.1 hypothetical protein [Bacteroides fragilis]